MAELDEAQVSRVILETYHEKVKGRLTSDVLIAGAGPSGLTAAFDLAERGLKVVLVERNLSLGGGIWGGGMGMNDVVVQDDALPILKKAGVRSQRKEGGLYAVDAVELASALILKAVQSGAVLLNLMTVEDLTVKRDTVVGAAVNRTTISGVLHVDPIMFSARVVVDATGHDAALVNALEKRGLLKDFGAAGLPGEGPMDVVRGEDFVVEHVAEVYPGLWVTGMSVCATFGGPRMGPVFGGMLLSGKRTAERIAASLK